MTKYDIMFFGACGAIVIFWLTVIYVAAHFIDKFW